MCKIVVMISISQTVMGIKCYVCKGFVKGKSPIYMVVNLVSIQVIAEFISNSYLGTKMGTLGTKIQILERRKRMLLGEGEKGFQPLPN